jgi:hypothetical protein
VLTIPDARVFCISVENQIPLAAKETFFEISDVARNLCHPSIVGVRHRSAAMSAFVALALEESQVWETIHQTRSTK